VSVEPICQGADASRCAGELMASTYVTLYLRSSLYHLHVKTNATIVVSCHGNTAKGLKLFVFESLRAQTEPSEKSLIDELHHGKVFEHAKLNYF
jgi:hypothetical protein